jgi:hypothetical protein
MAILRGFRGKRLAWTAASGVLLVAAFGAGCKGFFPKTTLQTVSIQPSSPQANVSQTITLQAWGTDSNNNRSQLTSGVGWSSGTTTVATVDGTGSATLKGISPGSSVITASAQGISGTATATVIGDVTQIVVSPTTASLKVGSTGQAFTFTATPGPPGFVTADNGGTLVIAPPDANFTCAVGTDANSNPAEVCTAQTGVGAGPFNIQMSYPDPSGGTVTSNTAIVTITP